MLRDNALAHANIVAHNESQHPAPITFAFSTAISFTFHFANTLALSKSFKAPLLISDNEPIRESHGLAI